MYLFIHRQRPPPQACYFPNFVFHEPCNLSFRTYIGDANIFASSFSNSQHFALKELFDIAPVLRYGKDIK